MPGWRPAPVAFAVRTWHLGTERRLHVRLLHGPKDCPPMAAMGRAVDTFRRSNKRSGCMPHINILASSLDRHNLLLPFPFYIVRHRGFFHLLPDILSCR